MNILVTSIVDLKYTSTNRLHHFVKHLAKRHNVTLLSIKDHYKAEHEGIELYTKDFDDALRSVDVKYFTERKISPILQEVFAAATIGRILDDADFRQFDVHFNYNTLFSGHAVARKLKSAGIDTVYDLADDLPGMVGMSPQIPAPLRPVARLVASQMVRRNISLASRITGITDELGGGLGRGKWRLLPNGVETELFRRSGSDAELRHLLGLHGTFVVGFVGGLREWIDFEPVFAAVRRLKGEHPTVKVLIVGGEGRLEETKGLAIEYGVADDVIFTGIVQYSHVPEYISCMDACLIPFDASPVARRSLPLKLFEYMACRRPVICTRLISVQELMPERVLFAETPEEYAAAMTKLATDDELVDRLATGGREFVEQCYDWAAITAKLEGVLEEVAAKRIKVRRHSGHAARNHQDVARDQVAQGSRR